MLTRLRDETEPRGAIREKVLLLLVAVGLSTLEFFIPRVPVFPWLKPGLANAVTLVWLIRFGYVESLLLVLVRTWITSFYFGFSFITTILGLSGALCAATTAAVLWKIGSRHNIFGLAGISIAAAFAHNAAQLGAVYLFLVRSTHLSGQVPVMAGASVVFGTVTGILAAGINTASNSELAVSLKARKTMEGYSSHPVMSLTLLIVCAAVTFVADSRMLGLVALVTTCVVQVVWRGSLRRLFLPVRYFWMFFVVIAVLQVWYGGGEPIDSRIPWLTREGLLETVRGWLRLWIWLQATSLFLFLKFHSTIHRLLKRWFPGHGETVYAAVIALELYPEVIERFRCRFFSLVGALVTAPRSFASKLVTLVVSVSNRVDEDPVRY